MALVLEDRISYRKHDGSIEGEGTVIAIDHTHQTVNVAKNHSPNIAYSDPMTLVLSEFDVAVIPSSEDAS